MIDVDIKVALNEWEDSHRPKTSARKRVEWKIFRLSKLLSSFILIRLKSRGSVGIDWAVKLTILSLLTLIWNSK